MKFLLFSFIVAVSMATSRPASCNHPASADTIRAIRLYGKIPVYRMNITYDTAESEYEVFYVGAYRINRYHYNMDTLVDGVLISTTWRPQYLVYEAGKQEGYFYDPATVDTSGVLRVSVDSVFHARNIQPFSFDDPSSMLPDSTFNAQDGDLIRIYRIPVDSTQLETVAFYIHYTKEHLGFTESLFPMLDTMQGRKISRVRIELGGGYYPDYGLSLPAREMDYQLKPFPVTDRIRNEILACVRTYKAQIRQ